MSEDSILATEVTEQSTGKTLREHLWEMRWWFATMTALGAVVGGGLGWLLL